MSGSPERRDRYLRDPVPVRLGNLASNLSRIAHLAHRAGAEQTLIGQMEESKYFIEWTGPDAAAGLQPDLARLQVKLALWQARAARGELSEVARDEMARQASEAAGLVLRASGLLESGAPQGPSRE